MSEDVLSELLYIHIAGTEIFGLHHGLISCVSGGFLFQWLCIHIEGMETFDLHGIISCVSEDCSYELLCIYIEGMETFDLHALILDVSEDFLS